MAIVNGRFTITKEDMDRIVDSSRAVPRYADELVRGNRYDKVPRLAPGENLADFDANYKPTLTPMAPTDDVRETLARRFGLAADAPAQVVIDTAIKAWSGLEAICDEHKKERDELRRELDACRQWRGRFADTLVAAQRNNERLRQRVGALLLEREEAKCKR